MGKFQRDKGARYERFIANELKDIWEHASRRGQMQSQTSSVDSDVHGTPYWIECKDQKRLSLPGAIQQARDELKAHRAKWPNAYHRGVLVCHRIPRKGDYVTMPLSEFQALWHELRLLRSESE